MFKDYYQILGIPFDSDFPTIKAAYRKQALRWHPDMHPDMDVKNIMQDINEAYAILKDPTKRERYNQEYIFFKKTRSNQSRSRDFSSNTDNNKDQKQSSEKQSRSKNSYYYDYDIKDENLKEDIRFAREYASKLVDEFFSELKRNSKLAAAGAWEGAKDYIYGLIFIIILGFIIKACAS